MSRVEFEVSLKQHGRTRHSPRCPQHQSRSEVACCRSNHARPCGASNCFGSPKRLGSLHLLFLLPSLASSNLARHLSAEQTRNTSVGAGDAARLRLSETTGRIRTKQMSTSQHTLDADGDSQACSKPWASTASECLISANRNAQLG